MFRNLFVRLPTVAAVDALQAFRLDRPRPAARAMMRRAFGPRPGLFLWIVAVAMGAAGALAIEATTLGWPGWAPNPGVVAFAALAAWRLHGPLHAPGTERHALRGALVSMLGPVLAVSAAGAAVHGFHDPGLVAVQNGMAQPAWAMGLLLAWLSTRIWLLAPIEPLVVGAAARGLLEVAWWFSEWGEGIAQHMVEIFVSPSLARLLELLWVYADTGLAFTVWSWLFAVTWMVSGPLLPAGTAPTRIPIWGTGRWILGLIWPG